jgi:hypothetical protein
MSVDGPGILQSDLGFDVYNQIIDLYDTGASVARIRQRLSQFEASLDDDVDLEIYLAASAKALWEIGQLEETRRKKLSRLLESGTSLRLWEEIGDRRFTRARKAALTRLVTLIANPRKSPRARKIYASVRRKLFSVGDCLHLVTPAKTYRGVVCKVSEHRGRCEYAILVVAPSKSFVTAKYYGTVVGPHVIRLEHRMLIREGNPFEVVSHIALDESKIEFGSFGGVLNIDDVIADFERTMNDAKVFGLRLLPIGALLQDDAG